MNPTTAMQWLTLATGVVLLVLVGTLGFYIIIGLWNEKIDLSKLISEPNGDASMSRFQFLIFTFVIAMSLFLVIAGAQGGPKFPAEIPATVLSLLGISGSSYLVSKGIQFSDPAGIYGPQKGLTITPDKPVMHVGMTQQFKADPAAGTTPAPKIKWDIVTGFGTITADGVYTADITKGPGVTAAAPAPPVHTTIQASVDGDPGIYDLAVVTILA